MVLLYLRFFYAVEQDSEEEGFSDDAEVVQNRPMTKRQRAKVYQEIPEEFLELPMGKNENWTSRVANEPSK